MLTPTPFSSDFFSFFPYAQLFLRFALELNCHMLDFSPRGEFNLENLSCVTWGVFELGKLGEEEDLSPALSSCSVVNYEMQRPITFGGKSALG